MEYHEYMIPTWTRTRDQMGFIRWEKVPDVDLSDLQTQGWEIIAVLPTRYEMEIVCGNPRSHSVSSASSLKASAMCSETQTYLKRLSKM